MHRNPGGVCSSFLAPGFLKVDTQLLSCVLLQLSFTPTYIVQDVVGMLMVTCVLRCACYRRDIHLQIIYFVREVRGLLAELVINST